MSQPVVPAPAAPVLAARGIRLRAVLDWSKQPGTQAGLSLLAGGCMLAWLHPFPSAEGIGATLLAASLPRLWPDNTTDAIKVLDVSNAIAHAAATRRPGDLERAASVAVEDFITVRRSAAAR